MTLQTNKSYFISESDLVLRIDADSRSTPLNHLILGDWLRYLGEESGEWIKIRCRGDNGWIIKSSITENRLLEVNFIDIGQGDGCHIVTPDDEIILIDAGEGKNMHRFLSWRYNLWKRKVVGVDGITLADSSIRPPLEIDHVLISHPDRDHYFGFNDIFESGKLDIKKVYHNGIVERPIPVQAADLIYPSGDDLGGYFEDGGEKYLFDIVTSNTEMKRLLLEHSTSRKQYISTLRKGLESNPRLKFESLSKAKKFLDSFDSTRDLTLRILAPITERKTCRGSRRTTLRKLGNEGVTKNGHSVVLRLEYGEFKMILGGDLNTQSQDYLVQKYANTDKAVSQLDKSISGLKEKENTLTAAERMQLEDSLIERERLVLKVRKEWEADVVKACHHGSHHFSESFLRILNACTTIISSGDNESHSHPRPDALGAFGKYGRGNRPLIFSTELARSTNEFTKIGPLIQRYLKAKDDFENAITDRERARAEKIMNRSHEKNVAVYGMITVRTDGKQAIIAQKLEKQRSDGQKWDIYRLAYNHEAGHFIFDPH